MQKFSKKLS